MSCNSVTQWADEVSISAIILCTNEHTPWILTVQLVTNLAFPESCLPWHIWLSLVGGGLRVGFSAEEFRI